MFGSLLLLFLLSVLLRTNTGAKSSLHLLEDTGVEDLGGCAVLELSNDCNYLLLFHNSVEPADDVDRTIVAGLIPNNLKKNLSISNFKLYTLPLSTNKSNGMCQITTRHLG